MRERLVELINKARDKYPNIPLVNGCKQDFAEFIADYLIENGVVVPPCKVGQTMWFIRNNKIIETKVEKIILKYGGLYIKLSCNSMYETTCNSIGKTVFLSREDAEAKLKGDEGK